MAAGQRGGRGDASGRVTLASPDGKWTASVRDTPPPKREITYVSEFEKRHEERFKGVEFDWLDFQRDGQPFRRGGEAARGGQGQGEGACGQLDRHDVFHPGSYGSSRPSISCAVAKSIIER